VHQELRSRTLLFAGSVQWACISNALCPVCRIICDRIILMLFPQVCSINERDSACTHSLRILTPVFDNFGHFVAYLTIRRGHCNEGTDAKGSFASMPISACDKSTRSPTSNLFQECRFQDLSSSFFSPSSSQVLPFEG